jgi:hypothetical protein
MSAVWEKRSVFSHTLSNRRGEFEDDTRAVARSGAAALIHTCTCSTADERPPQLGAAWLVSIIVNQPSHAHGTLLLYISQWQISFGIRVKVNNRPLYYHFTTI